MGPIPYSIKYKDSRDLQLEIDSLLSAFNESLSTYISYSELSLFNKSNTAQYTSPFFYPVLELSREVYEKSGGNFDPTVGPLVNAWGFGKNKKARVDSTQIDSLMQFVGFDQVKFDQKGVSKPGGFYLDFSASAKGYAIDLVADLLKDKGITDYMVEIGGEVSCAGKNPKNNVWKIGIQKPSTSADKVTAFATSFLKNKAMATSGNYRNYYLVDNQMVAHTINPKTGYSEIRNLLSATIFSESCGLADAYATAAMVMGVEQSIEMIERIEEIEGFLIYTDDKGEFQSYVSKGMAKQIDILD